MILVCDLATLSFLDKIEYNCFIQSIGIVLYFSRSRINAWILLVTRRVAQLAS